MRGRPKRGEDRYRARAAVAAAGSSPAGLPRSFDGLRQLPGIGPYTARAVLAFVGVQSVRSRSVSKDIDAVHSLMDVKFESAAEPPGGVVTLVFSGQTQIQLNVECIDVSLVDTGPAWPTRRRPDHEKTS